MVEKRALTVSELISQLKEIEKIDPAASVYVYGFWEDQDEIFEEVLRVVYDKETSGSHVELAIV